MNLTHICWLLFIDFIKALGVLFVYWLGKELVPVNIETPPTKQQMFFCYIKGIGLCTIGALWLGNGGQYPGNGIKPHSIEFLVLFAAACCFGINDEYNKEKKRNRIK